MEPKPISSYHQKIKDKIKFESRYDVESWYDSMKSFTFKTEFMNLKISEGKALRKLYRQRFLSGDPLSKTETLCLEQLKKKIDLLINQKFLNQGIFLRLSTRSPKDSALDFSNEKKNEIYRKGILEILRNYNPVYLPSKFEKLLTKEGFETNCESYLNSLSEEESNEILVFLMDITKQSLKIFNGEEAIELLSSSERVSIDLYHMLVYKDADQECLVEDLDLCKLVLREWVDLKDIDEFRCFFYNKKLTAISQYNFYIYDKNLTGKKEIIKETINDYFNKLLPFLNVNNGVIDLSVSNQNVWVIELNPFNDYPGAGTGGSLFCWKNDIEILKNGPLEIRVVENPSGQAAHRISLFGAEKILIECIKKLITPEKTKDFCIIY